MAFPNPSQAGLEIIQAASFTAQKTLLSLQNVDNTSDATKNAATATLTNKTLTAPVINSPTGLVKADVGLSNVDNTSDANKPVSTATQTALDLKAPLASPTFTGTVTVPTATAGDSTTKAASTAFVAAAVSVAQQGLTPKGSTRAATTTALPACTYANGSSGVGATLTADANGALPAQDGVTLVASDLLLVKDQSSGLQNGIYVVTAVGDGSNPFVLTRATNFNSATTIVPNSYVFINEGTSLADTGWTLNTNAPITVGTTALTFGQFSGAGQITAGDALSKSGNTLNVNVDNSTIEVSSDALQVKDSGITSAKISGTISVAKGGTNSATLLNNNRVMQSASGAIVEAAAITASRALVSDSNGIPTHSAVTSTELGYVSGVTGAIQTQFSGKAAVRAYSAISGTANLAYNTDHNASVPGAAYTVTLPAAATGQGDITLTNVSNSANAITVSGGGANIIGASTYVMPVNGAGQYYSVTFYTDGTNWFIK